MNEEQFKKLDLGKIVSEESNDVTGSFNRFSDGKSALSEIQNLLNKRNVGSIGRKLDEPCKNCGEKEVYCGHIDIGAVDYYDNFWHICLNCLDANHQEIFTLWGSEQDGDTNCPYCNYKW